MPNDTQTLRWPIDRLNPSVRRRSPLNDRVSCAIDLSNEEELRQLLDVVGRSNETPFRGALPGAVRVVDLSLSRPIASPEAAEWTPAVASKLRAHLVIACVTPLLHRHVQSVSFVHLDELLPDAAELVAAV